MIQSIAALVLGALGKKDLDLPSSDLTVSHRAVLSALRELMDAALEEAGPWDGTDGAAYLTDSEGYYIVDPDDAAGRADQLLSLLDVEHDALLELLSSRSARSRIGEALIEPLSTHLSNRARFRAGVPTTTVFPYSAVCQLRMQMSNRGSDWFIGTGFYIGPNRILTAGHNILHAKHGSATRMIVTPARNGAGSHLEASR